MFKIARHRTHFYIHPGRRICFCGTEIGQPVRFCSSNVLLVMIGCRGVKGLGTPRNIHVGVNVSPCGANI